MKINVSLDLRCNGRNDAKRVANVKPTRKTGELHSNSKRTHRQNELKHTDLDTERIKNQSIS